MPRGAGLDLGRVRLRLRLRLRAVRVRVQVRVGVGVGVGVGLRVSPDLPPHALLHVACLRLRALPGRLHLRLSSARLQSERSGAAWSGAC